MGTSPSKPSLGDIIRAFSRAEQAIAAGCILVIVSIFVPWKGYGGGLGGNLTGLHGVGLLTLLIALATSAFFVARSPFFRNLVALPRLPVTDAVAYIIAGVAEIVTVLLFSSQHGAPLQAMAGFYIALAGGALTAFGGYLVIRGRAAAPAIKADPTTEARVRTGPAKAAEPAGVGGRPTSEGRPT